MDAWSRIHNGRKRKEGLVDALLSLNVGVALRMLISICAFGRPGIIFQAKIRAEWRCIVLIVAEMLVGCCWCWVRYLVEKLCRGDKDVV